MSLYGIFKGVTNGQFVLKTKTDRSLNDKILVFIVAVKQRFIGAGAAFLQVGFVVGDVGQAVLQANAGIQRAAQVVG
jgi:hypothetical protein